MLEIDLLLVDSCNHSACLHAISTLTVTNWFFNLLTSDYTEIEFSIEMYYSEVGAFFESIRDRFATQKNYYSISLHNLHGTCAPILFLWCFWLSLILYVQRYFDSTSIRIDFKWNFVRILLVPIFPEHSAILIDSDVISIRHYSTTNNLFDLFRIYKHNGNICSNVHFFLFLYQYCLALFSKCRCHIFRAFHLFSTFDSATAIFINHLGVQTS